MLVTKLTAVLNESAGCTFAMSVGLNGSPLWTRWITYRMTKPTTLNASIDNA